METKSKPCYFLELSGKIGYYLNGSQNYGILPGDEIQVAKFIRDVTGMTNKVAHGFVSKDRLVNQFALSCF